MYTLDFYTLVKAVKERTHEFTNSAWWKISLVFVLTGGNVLFASEMQTHLNLLKKMECLSKYQLP